MIDLRVSYAIVQLEALLAEATRTAVVRSVFDLPVAATPRGFVPLIESTAAGTSYEVTAITREPDPTTWPRWPQDCPASLTARNDVLLGGNDEPAPVHA